MMVRISREYDRPDFREIMNFHYKKLAEKVIEAVLKSEGCPFGAEADITRLMMTPFRKLIEKCVRSIK